MDVITHPSWDLSKSLTEDFDWRLKQKLITSKQSTYLSYIVDTMDVDDPRRKEPAHNYRIQEVFH